MKYFKKVTDIIMKLMIPLVILALLIGISRVILDLRIVFKSQIDTGFNILLTNILSLFVVIELLRSIIEYFEVQRLRLTLIADAVLVFILRETMIRIYQHNIEPLEIASLGGLLSIVGGLRTLAILYSPGKTREVQRDEK